MPGPRMTAQESNPGNAGRWCSGHAIAISGLRSADDPLTTEEHGFGLRPALRARADPSGDAKNPAWR